MKPLEIRNFILKKVQIATRLKELQVPIADAFVVHQILHQLSSAFD